MSTKHNEIKGHEAAGLGSVLDEITSIFRQLVVYEQPLAPEASTLWACHNRAFKAASHNPILMVTAPDEGAGKSATLVAFSAVSQNAQLSYDPSPASIYRASKGGKGATRTFLIDEADTGTFDRQQMVGFINAAWTPEGAKTIRAEERQDGKGYESEDFSFWHPYAFAMIGLPEAATLRSRCWILQLRKVDAHSPEAEWLLRGKKRREALARLKVLGAELGTLLQPHLDALRDAEPEYPVEISDFRQRDNVRLMLAVADLAGDHWPETARKAVTQVTRQKAQLDARTEEVLELGLLYCEAFERDWITAEEWITYGELRRQWSSKFMTVERLANLVKPLRASRKPGREGRRAGGRGYRREDITRALGLDPAAGNKEERRRERDRPLRRAA